MIIIKLLFPSGDKQQVDEIESFTLTWHTLSGWGGDYNEHNKVFTSKEDAEKYMIQLQEANKFLQTNKSIDASIKRN